MRAERGAQRLGTSKGPMDQFTAHLDRGWDLVSRGDFAGAMVSAQKSLELDGQSPEAHNLIGYIFAAEGRAEEALEHYKQAIELDEGFVEAMLNAAEVLVHPLGDTDAALEMIEDALYFAEGDDEVADAMLLKFDALMHANDRDAAARVVAALPDGPFESPHLDFLIGRARFDVGDFASAEQRIRAALDREPDNAEAHYYLGLVLEQKGDARGATVAFLEARDRDLRYELPPWSLEPRQFERRVQGAINALAPAQRDALDGSLVVVSDAPGAEVVAEGVDPRVGVLLDDLSPAGQTPRVGRVFVYQRNIERVAQGVAEVEEQVVHALEHELAAAFPTLTPDGEPAGDRKLPLPTGSRPDDAGSGGDDEDGRGGGSSAPS